MKAKIIKAFSNFEDFDIPTAIFRALDFLPLRLKKEDAWVLRDCVKTKLFEMDKREFVDFFFSLAEEWGDDNSGVNYVYPIAAEVFRDRLWSSGFYND